MNRAFDEVGAVRDEAKMARVSTGPFPEEGLQELRAYLRNWKTKGKRHIDFESEIRVYLSTHPDFNGVTVSKSAIGAIVSEPKNHKKRYGCSLGVVAAILSFIRAHPIDEPINATTNTKNGPLKIVPQASKCNLVGDPFTTPITHEIFTNSQDVVANDEAYRLGLDVTLEPFHVGDNLKFGFSKLRMNLTAPKHAKLKLPMSRVESIEPFLCAGGSWKWTGTENLPSWEILPERSYEFSRFLTEEPLLLVDCLKAGDEITTEIAVLLEEMSIAIDPSHPASHDANKRGMLDFLLQQKAPSIAGRGNYIVISEGGSKVET